MSSQALKAAATGQGNQPVQAFPKMIEQFKGEIARALPKHMSADRMTRIALTEFRKNPKLGKCQPASVFAAVVLGSQLGLEPGILGQSYLVPYGSECQFIPGWQGYVDLVSRTGRATAWTGAVFEGDEFDYALGDRPFIKHKPCGEDDPAKMIYAYAVGRVNGSEWPVIEVWPASRITKHRNKFNKVGKGHYSYSNWEMYSRKVVLLQVIKYMPKSVELNQAASLDAAADAGQQNISMSDAIDGTFVYVPEDGDSNSQNTQQSGGLSTGDIKASLESSKNIDELNEAADLIRTLPEDQRAELNALYDKRAAELQ